LIKYEEIQNTIYTIRGVQVMLDKDLAIFYGVKPIRLREQVKRNIKRFPSDFMFQLTEEEVNLMVSQNAIPSKQHLGGSLPFVFTEQGVATISAVLTSERAIEINIQIMRAFVTMRHFIASSAGVFQRLDAVEKRQIEHKLIRILKRFSMPWKTKKFSPNRVFSLMTRYLMPTSSLQTLFEQPKSRSPSLIIILMILF